MDLTETKALLRSRQLTDVQDAILERTGPRAVPEQLATPYQKMFSRVGIGSKDVLDLFDKERDLFIRFAKAAQRAARRNSLDGEFPPGEEPDPGDRSRNVEAVGVQNGFALVHACEFLLLRNRGRVALKDFYAWRRIPQAVRSARQRDELLRGLRGTGPEGGDTRS